MSAGFSSLTLFVFVLTTVISFGQSAGPDSASAADAIMARVGANQDGSEKLRGRYLCREHIHVATRKLDGKVMREETSDYEIVPTERGTDKQLKTLTGRYWHKGKYEGFNGQPVPQPNSWDADYIRDVRRCLSEEESRCTVAAHLFPLTTGEQNKYEFRIIGQEVLVGRNAYHISFVPKNKNAFNWSGEAFIDVTDFQPIRVFTRLSRRVPFFVRATGTNVSGIGYELEYRRLEDGNWFPRSYGTEYEIHLFFRINRTISISMDTSFERAEPTAGTSGK
jgi:hypothetical protein